MDRVVHMTILAIIYCLGLECVTMHFPPATPAQCAAMRRLVILASPDHAIGPDEVQLEEPGVAGTLTEELEQAERRLMAEALAQSGGSRADAARALGMARTTFVTKMKRYGIR